MRKAAIIFITLFFSFHGLAQNREADSLFAASRNAQNDIERARLLNDAADKFKSTDATKTIQFGTEALQLSRKIKYKLAEGNANLNLGNGNLILGDYKKALDHFSNARQLFESEPSTAENAKEISNGLARAYGSIGIVFSEQSNYPKALQYHLKAARIYESADEPVKIARIYNNIGIAYQSLGEKFKALEYFIKCLKIQEKNGDNTVGITTTNIGNIYLAQKNYQKAFEYYQKAQSLFDRYPNARGLGELHNNLASYYLKTGEHSKAVEACNKAIAIFDSIGDKFGSSDSYALLGEIFYEKGDYLKALSNTARSLALGKLLNVPERVRDSEKKMSEIYIKLDKPAEALEHYRQYSIANDSISNFENIRSSVRAEINYEFEKKEALRKKEQEKKELLYIEQERSHRQQIIFGVLFLILIFGIIFLVYNRAQMKKTLTLQKELAQYEQKALHLQMNPHFVFNCLGSISSFIVQNGTDSAIKYLAKFSKLMRLTLEYSKESLIPIDKEIESLQNYLELEQLRFNNVFEFQITKSSAIDDDIGLPPLLLQPFVENAIIHGLIPKKEQGKIDISFTLESNNLICTILDNGIGYEKSQELKENLVNVHKSMALDITRKRLEMMQSYTSKTAQVEIVELKNDDGKTAGTKAVLKLPIQYTAVK